MAAQVAFPLLARAMGFAKGLTGAGKAAGAAAPTIKGMLAGQTARRMAGQTMGEFGKRLGPIGFGSQDAITNTALMFGPDLAFGALAGSMTPGDLGDKMIAGTMTGLGGAVGGAGARGLYGGKNAAVQMGLELGGGFGGDMVGQGISDNLLRLKGGGTTPYEKMAADQQQELERQILTRYLSGKGGYPAQDQFLVENGLG